MDVHGFPDKLRGVSGSTRQLKPDGLVGADVSSVASMY